MFTGVLGTSLKQLGRGVIPASVCVLGFNVRNDYKCERWKRDRTRDRQLCLKLRHGTVPDGGSA
jgi:hypothetical protein